eukprot:CAMPEP_0183748210 /NCGR_PEP_ID=MMETSP0737-20130205/67652_1 /TAXON_ID=385413 /ORGANISM="Thalassiosira miniscula, Strain CCMP1093" /LENGTH=428 /DNA_ID=CAMNT_0025983929 /DNA_START=137 /DNA_END=1423 /DNA_ORIENTATION=+
MPYNFLDLLTLDEENARTFAGQKIKISPPTKEPPHNGDHMVAGREQKRRQIQVNSTIDADVVLRRIIEDRAAILALKSRAATNESELTKAKTRQLEMSKILDLQDKAIDKLTKKANYELVAYNESCKNYIKSFGLAFQNGDMDKLPQHPFGPSLEGLEQAMKWRKTTIIEKVQMDDRVKKLEFIDSQERVTMEVMKKNEEAFLRAIEISKQKFTVDCVSWHNRVRKLLSGMPDYANKFDNLNFCAGIQTSQVQQNEVPAKTFRYPPPPIYEGNLKRQSHAKEGTSLDSPRQRPTVQVLRSEGNPHPVVGTFRPMWYKLPQVTQSPIHQLLTQRHSPGYKRQKMESQSVQILRHMISSNDASIVDLSIGDEAMADEQTGAGNNIDKKTIANDRAIHNQDLNCKAATMNGKISIRPGPSLEGAKFAVSNI